MAPLNFTIEGDSPLILYSEARLGANFNHTTPSASDEDGISQFTSPSNATTSFSFFGTGVSLYGAHRDGHGNYSIRIDDNPALDLRGSQQAEEGSLWSITGLPFAQHTVIITNQHIMGGDALDLDYIVIERQIGSALGEIYEHKLDDTSRFMDFTPGDAWTLVTDPSSGYNQSLHRATAKDANLGILFTGCCIEIHGRSLGSSYNVTLDNGEPIQYGSPIHQPDSTQQQQNTVLYVMDGLDENIRHNFTLTTVDANESSPLYVDYAVLQTSVANTELTAQSTNVPMPTGNVPTGNVHVIGVIIGAVFGGMVLLGLLIMRCYIVRNSPSRRNSGTKKSTGNFTASFAFTSVTPSIPSPVHEYPLDGSFGSSSISRTDRRQHSKNRSERDIFGTPDHSDKKERSQKETPLIITRLGPGSIEEDLRPGSSGSHTMIDSKGDLDLG